MGAGCLPVIARNPVNCNYAAKSRCVRHVLQVRKGMVRVGRYLPNEKPRRRAKAFPTVCKRMHEHQLRKSKPYRSLANARTAIDANSRTNNTSDALS
jgi:hypothetical protein